ncbi:MAG: hypothetical protein ACI9LX_003181 [Paraglaciecola sp.]|jgi:hypothetical protein
MEKLLPVSIVAFVSLNSFAVTEEITVHPIDINKDSLLSTDEAEADDTLSAIFLELDINQYGFLSHLELEVKTGSLYIITQSVNQSLHPIHSMNHRIQLCV